MESGWRVFCLPLWYDDTQNLGASHRGGGEPLSLKSLGRGGRAHVIKCAMPCRYIGRQADCVRPAVGMSVARKIANGLSLSRSPWRSEEAKPPLATCSPTSGGTPCTLCLVAMRQAGELCSPLSRVTRTGSVPYIRFNYTTVHYTHVSNTLYVYTVSREGLEMRSISHPE